MALAAYRHLFRATRLAFAGDLELLHASRAQIREGFLANRSLEESSPDFEKAVKHAEGVAEILRTNIVQGRKQGTGESYKLNIHKDIERGDNDTVKNPRAPGGKVRVGSV